MIQLIAQIAASSVESNLTWFTNTKCHGFVTEFLPLNFLSLLTMSVPEFEETRPSKRQKIERPDIFSAPIPLDVLLLSLPQILAHPATHPTHTRSLVLSQFALRKYLSLPNLDSVSECRAWAELAEVGLRIGLHEPGIESEVGKAITKAVSLRTSIRKRYFEWKSSLAYDSEQGVCPRRISAGRRC